MTHSQIEAQEIIELYLLKRLAGEVQAEFEEHFLSCPECLEQLEGEQESIDTIRETCAAFPFDVGGKRSRAWRFWLPVPAWGAALAVGVVALCVIVVSRPRLGDRAGMASHSAAIPAPAVALPVVTLESSRGGAAANAAIAASTAARPFLLHLDARGLQPYEQYSVVLVGDSGQPVWSGGGMARADHDWIEARVEQAPLAPGNYWVRVSGSRQGGAAQLLREYSLVVGP
ncbi:MAG TPA: hypothetical protein VEU62_22100 [Bryobacterales bacterium]|nr:hypothetical protein [Bryobacterales bacterium]